MKATDSKGASAVTRLTVTAGNSAPTASIAYPNANVFTLAGQPTKLIATGSDPEDGPLPDSAFKWNVELHHKEHVHPESIVTGSTGQFVAVRDHDADSYYTVTLTVTDSEDLSTTLPPILMHVSVMPIKVSSNIKGVEVSYGGRDLKTPESFRTAIGFAANLSAPKRVTIKGKKYKFVRWSQGGPRVQNFNVPPRKTRLKVFFKRIK
jgi:hypothetical protein